MSHLEGIAADMGVAITPVEALPRGRWGQYSHGRRRIRLLEHMAPVQCWSTLAHELGHAHYEHRRTTARAELEADIWAARQLIHPGQWRELTAAHADLLTVADELQVLPRIAKAYAMLRHSSAPT